MTGPPVWTIVARRSGADLLEWMDDPGVYVVRASGSVDDLQRIARNLNGLEPADG